MDNFLDSSKIMEALLAKGYQVKISRQGNGKGYYDVKVWQLGLEHEAYSSYGVADLTTALIRCWEGMNDDHTA